MNLTLREVQLADLETFRRWRADPRYAEMLRRPGTPETLQDSIEWYRAHKDREWWTVLHGERVCGYVMLTPHGLGIAEVSVLTDPDANCDREALQLLVAQAAQLGYDRLIAETYTPSRHALVLAIGFTEARHWTLLLRRPGRAIG